MGENLVLRGTMRAHTDMVTAIAIPIDNSEMIVSASRDKSIILWHLNKDEKTYGVPRRRLTGHSHFVEDVVLSSDGQFALSGSWDGELRLWDLALGVSARRFVGHTKDVLSVAFSIDNRQIVSASRDRTIKLWNTLGECKFTIQDQDGHGDWVSCVRFRLNCMSKLISFSLQNPRKNYTLFNSIRPSSSSSSSSSSPSWSNSLHDRIKVIRDPKASVLPVLEQWVSEGQAVEKQQLQSLVRLLKDFRRFNHALEISQWMTDRRYFDLSPSDAAARLNLIHRVHGLDHAENYFNNLPKSLKSLNAYGALLCIYVQERSVEKAEATMQKMKKMDMAKTSFPYNMLINLYSQNGQYEKINILMQEMEENGIPIDKYTLRNRMMAYIAASDMPGMEAILNRMEEDPNLIVDWKIYSMAANGYLKVGLTEKAISMLKMLEGLMPLQGRKSVEFLLTLYASTGNKEELYRVWDTYKPSNEPVDVPYGCMISSLAKLDDIEGAEGIFEEWESQFKIYDFRVLNRLLVAYCKGGLFDKAESVVNKATEGRIPYASTWNVLAIGYTEKQQMPKAVEMLKKALSVGRRGWVPHSPTLTACLDYLEGQGDIEGIEEIISLLKNLGPLSEDLYHRLLRASVAAGKSVAIILDQMKVDGFTADEEAYKVIETSPS